MTTQRQTILLVDDECETRNMLRIILDLEDFNIIEAENGQSALQKLKIDPPDLILLDLGLPDITGMEVIERARDFSNVPIVVLTAETGDEHLVAAFKKGANDYVTKPFNLDVLLARIVANMRTHPPSMGGPGELSNGGIRIDLDRHEVYIDDQLTAFSPKEFGLLATLVRHKGKMMTHRQILKEVWGPNHADDLQYVRVYTAQVRAKLQRAGNLAKSIVCESGIGYRMDVLGDDAPADRLQA